MLLKTAIRPYHKGEALDLLDFAKKALFLIGDDDFESPGKHGLYVVSAGEHDYVAIAEVEVKAVRHLGGASSALVLTKLAVEPPFYDEELIHSLLLYLFVEARRLGVDLFFLEGAELPYEKELGFVPAATLGVYNEKEPEAHIPSLRLLRLNDQDVPPGFLL